MDNGNNFGSDPLKTDAAGNQAEISEAEKEQKRIYRHRRTVIRVCAFAVLGAVLIYMFFCILNHTGLGLVYSVILCSALLLYWVLMDIAAPFAGHDFDGIDKKRLDAYKIFALLELVGFGGLAYFGLSASNGNSSFIGAFIFLMATLSKRNYYDRYANPPEETSEEGDEDAQSAQSADAENVSVQDAAKAAPLTAAGRLARLQARIDSEAAEDAEAAENAEAVENTEVAEDADTDESISADDNTNNDTGEDEQL